MYQNDGQTCYSDAIAVKLSPTSFHFGSKPFQLRIAFMNEITFYTKVVPLFDSFRPCTLFPKFYSSAIEANSFETREFIVFENLQSSGYVLSSRLSFLDLPHLRLMVRKLGEFHAYSLIALQTDASDFHAAVKSMYNHKIDILKLEETPLLMAIKRGLKLLSNDNVYSGKADIIREKLNRAHEHVYNVLRGVTYHEDDILVLCHGDYLSTNVMFRYENNTPIDMKLVDMANC